MTPLSPLLAGFAGLLSIVLLLPVAARAADDIRIAVAVPRTGTVATAGDQVVAGAQEAAKAINAKGGSTDGKAVAAALRGGAPIDTVIGPLRFDAKGDAVGITYEIDVWKGGTGGWSDRDYTFL